MPFSAASADPLSSLEVKCRRRLATSLRLAGLAMLALSPGLGHAATFALSCSKETTFLLDGLGAQVGRPSKRATTHVIDDVAQKVGTFMPDRRTLGDLCAAVQHCEVKVGAEKVEVTGVVYLAVSKLWSRLTIERQSGRGVSEQTIDHENLDTARFMTPLASRY